MYNRKDVYYKKAKQEGYKSRAAYKLIELNQKYKLIRGGDKVLDCGAAPGGWSQVALNLVGLKGCVVAVDYAIIEGIEAPNFTFLQGDMTSSATVDKVISLANGTYDVVLSDMAPKTTGIRLKDHLDSIELVHIALSVAEKTLKKGGIFIVKIFDGGERESFVKEVKGKFTTIKTVRPDSTRKESFEMYLVATGFKKDIVL